MNLDAPKDDSPDLSDEDIQRAIETHNDVDVASHLQDGYCPECGSFAAVVRHELRRRQPHLYWRTLLQCASGHPTSKVFRVDWLGGSP